MYLSVFLLTSLWWGTGFTHAATDLTNTTHLVKNTYTDSQTRLPYAPIGTAAPGWRSLSTESRNPNLPTHSPPPAATPSASASASSSSTPSPTSQPSSSSSASASASSYPSTSSPVSRSLQEPSAFSPKAVSSGTVSLPSPHPTQRTGLSLGSIAIFCIVGLLLTCNGDGSVPDKGSADTVIVDCV